MARNRKRTSAPPRSAANKSGVTPERAVRLHRLLDLLRKGPQTRKVLLHRVRVDQRAFYRDLDTLREAGIDVVLERQRYHLLTPPKEALLLLPFPDPLLTLGEAMLLAPGRTRAHRLLKQRIRELIG